MPLPAGSVVTTPQFNSVYALTEPWLAFTPTWTATTTNPVLGNGTLSGRYMQAGKSIFYRGSLVMGSTTTFGSGTWNFSLPVTPLSANQVGPAYLSDADGTTYPAVVTFFNSILFLAATGGNVTPTSPFTWAVNDMLQWTVVYESA